MELAVSKKRQSGPPAIKTLKGKKLIAFGWYGGKFSHLDWLMPLLPECHHYCEPFAGSGAVLLNRKPSPIETYNDLDGEVVNFFRILRDQKEAMIEALALTPFSREEFAIACQIGPELTSLERARRFYVRARQVRYWPSTNRYCGSMGQLQRHKPWWYEWCCKPLAGRY